MTVPDGDVGAEEMNPASYTWDPYGNAVALRDALLALEGPTGILGTTIDTSFDALDEQAQSRIRYGLKLIAEWAEHEPPTVAVDCILSEVLHCYQVLHGKLAT